VATRPDLGLGGLLHRKGEGRGVDPRHAADEPPAEDDPKPPQGAARAPAAEGPPQQPPVTPRPPADRQQGQGALLRPGARLPAAMRPSNATAKRNVQVLLPEEIADRLKFMSLCERTSQQRIMETAITAALVEWESTYQQGREGA
jgi:hypothetical protein